ncbi:hypothetical protein ABI59_14000 [Acidobacteria bacterium Mor1]|nr:hypothetical protein ABI59_14000 [Acidobacteria bacterium Mor1]
MNVSHRIPALILALALPVAAVADWPHIRGPQADGTTLAQSELAGESVGLKVDWKIDLGSAYSGIVSDGDKAVTMFADDSGDWLGAFEASSGKELWRYKLGDITQGEDGADDGPLSNPTLGHGHVYALGSRGVLHAVRLDNGKKSWSKSLADDFGGKTPHFGFTTTPLIVDKLVVVQAGGDEGRSIVALDAKSGEKRWTHGEGSIDYQSPVLMTLGGKQQIVAVNSTGITGLDTGGRQLWTLAFEEGQRANSTTPAFIGNDRFLINSRPGVIAYEVRKSGAGFEAAELYRSDVLGQSYAAPVYHEGHVYGFRGKVLACMNAETGERVWRSRPPGGDGLILVDGKLVIFAAKGNVVIADATTDGYKERAVVQALEGSSLTWPSFAGGRVFVRNLEDMAAVSLAAKAAEAASGGDAAQSHAFGEWLTQLAQSGERKGEMIDAFMARHERMPVIDGEWVHFVYRGDVEEVALAGSMLGGSPEPMHRVEGTDLFHLSYKLPEGLRFEYSFQTNYSDWTHDPNNDRTVPAIFGDNKHSEFFTTGYQQDSHVEVPDGPRGQLETFTLTSKILGYDKEIKVWLPPSYAEGRGSYPVLVVNDGHTWLDKGLMQNSLDNLVGDRMRPVIAAFVPSHRQWWLEAGGTRTEDFVRMQVDELLPALRERYRVAEGERVHAVMGTRYYGISAAMAALLHDEVFGGAAIQSVALGMGGDRLIEEITTSKAKGLRMYLDWNRFDEKDIDRGYDTAADSRRLAGVFESSGHALAGGERSDSAGWSGWRNRTDEILATLFPAGS